MLTIFTNTSINFLKKAIASTINFLHHFFTTILLTKTQFVILSRNTKSRFECSQIRQCCQISYIKICSKRCLKIDSDKSHKIFHTTNFLLVIFLSKYLRKNTHICLLFYIILHFFERKVTVFI